jgi:Domain of unknown function (DUF5710)
VIEDAPVGEDVEWVEVVSTKTWLDVPYAEKDKAKALGARWDPEARRWYAPWPDIAELERWQALPDIPELLPGEDREFGQGLFVDLVPSSCWFTNVRSCVAGRDWERLRRMVLKRAGHRCEACHRGQDREAQRWLEVHERWAYDERSRIQALRRVICLCTDCHTATHFGLASIKGKGSEALKHLCAVTGLSADETKRQVKAAFELWDTRSQFDWKLDLGILAKAGVTLEAPPRAKERGAIADKTLREVE